MMPRSILIVDDIKDWREQLRSTLELNGYHIETAASYDEALKKVAYLPIGLVLVDLRLDPTDETNRDGMVLLEKLAEMRINAVVVTGYGTPDAKARAEQLEVIAVLEKSRLSKLRTVVNRIFEEMERRDMLRAQAAKKFAQGLAVGYSAEAAGYPLRPSLSDELTDVLEKSE